MLTKALKTWSFDGNTLLNKGILVDMSDLWQLDFVKYQILCWKRSKWSQTNNSRFMNFWCRKSSKANKCIWEMFQQFNFQIVQIWYRPFFIFLFSLLLNEAKVGKKLQVPSSPSSNANEENLLIAPKLVYFEISICAFCVCICSFCILFVHFVFQPNVNREKTLMEMQMKRIFWSHQS